MEYIEKKKYPLLMTGTIDPQKYGGEVKSVSERLQKYENAITRYICETRFNPIVFVENSGYLFDIQKFEKMAEKYGKTFEFVKGTVCRDEVIAHGKGYGDALLIYEGLTKSDALKNIDIFYKVTGRIFLKNSEKILKNKDKRRNEFISYDGMGWCMTYFFKSNKEDYLRILGDVYKECDDRSVRDIEICFWIRLQKANVDVGSFVTYPDIEGNMGETNIPYKRSEIERKLRSIGIKVGVFTMNSKASKCFWFIYGKLSGRKPYVKLSNCK